MTERDIVERLRGIAKSKCRREEGEDWRDIFEWQAADEVTRLRALLEEERQTSESLRTDWFRFCKMMGVEIDTQEAVAARLHARALKET